MLSLYNRDPKTDSGTHCKQSFILCERKLRHVQSPYRKKASKDAGALSAEWKADEQNFILNWIQQNHC